MEVVAVIIHLSDRATLHTSFISLATWRVVFGFVFKIDWSGSSEDLVTSELPEEWISD